MKYTVKKPIAGFEEVNEVELVSTDGIATHMKSTDNDSMNMVLLNSVMNENEIVPKFIIALLDIDENTNYSVYFSVVINQDISKSLINFAAPLIFNEDNKTMAQFSADSNIVTLDTL